MLKVGAVAPDFTAPLSSGQMFTLSSLRGKQHVVLYFYPKDFTAGCTKQACSLRDNYTRLVELNTKVIGVSQDTEASHLKFIRENALPFPLISDPERRVIGLYGVARLAGWVNLPRRVTYVIDRHGVIRDVIHHEFRIGKHLDRVLETLTALEAEWPSAERLDKE